MSEKLIFKGRIVNDDGILLLKTKNVYLSLLEELQKNYEEGNKIYIHYTIEDEEKSYGEILNNFEELNGIITRMEYDEYFEVIGECNCKNKKYGNYKYDDEICSDCKCHQEYDIYEYFCISNTNILENLLYYEGSYLYLHINDRKLKIEKLIK